MKILNFQKKIATGGGEEGGKLQFFALRKM